MFEISIKTTKETDELLKNMPEMIKKSLFNGFRKANYFLESKVKSSITDYLHVRTGNLRRSIFSRVEERSSYLIGIIGSNLIYANILHEGGVIKPKNKSYLAFKIGNSWIRTQMVTIPSRPYIREPMEKNIDNAGDIVLNEIEKEFR